MKRKILTIVGLLLILTGMGMAQHWRYDLFTRTIYYDGGGISLTSLSSTATGLNYNNTTGVFSLTVNYMIPGPATAGYYLRAGGAGVTPAFAAIADGDLPATIKGFTLAPQTNGFTITAGTTPKTLTVALDASVSGTNTGDNAANTTYAIGSQTQAYSANLTTYAGITPSANAQTLLGETFAQMLASIGASAAPNLIVLTNNATQNVTLVQGALNIITNASLTQNTIITFIGAAVTTKTRLVILVDAAYTVAATNYAGDKWLVGANSYDTITSDAVVGSSFTSVCAVATKNRMTGMEGSWAGT